MSVVPQWERRRACRVASGRCFVGGAGGLASERGVSRNLASTRISVAWVNVILAPPKKKNTESCAQFILEVKKKTVKHMRAKYQKQT